MEPVTDPTFVTPASAPTASAPSLGDVPLGPLDGRYRAAVAPLAEHLSEAALNRERVQVEVEWLIHLTSTGAVPGAPAADGRRDRTAAGRRRGLRAQRTSPSSPRSSG